MRLLTTARLHLRDYEEDDWRRVHEYASDAEVCRYMEWGPNSADDTREFMGPRGRANAVGDVLIRTAEKGDAGRLAGLMGVLGYPTTVKEMEQRLQRILDNPRYRTLVAVDEGALVGMIGMEMGFSYQLCGNHLRILALVVDERARGRGIGRALVAAAEQWAVSQGARRVRVSSGNRPERAGAHAFYRRAGYEAKGTSFHKQLRPS